MDPLTERRHVRAPETARTSRPWQQALPLALGVAAYGLMFGALASEAGVSLAQAVTLSMVTFTGASQIALVSILVAGGSAAAALTAGLLLALRNTAYGLVLSQTFTSSRRIRFLAAHFVIDETTAVATVRGASPAARTAFWTTGICIYLCWNLGTLAGVLAGDLLAAPEAYGLDVAFPAAFVALVAPQLRHTDGRAAVLGGAVIGAVMLPLVPAGLPVLLAALAVVPAPRLSERSRT